MIVLGSKRRRRFPRFGGSGLREHVTAVSGLPTVTAPAPLKIPRRIDTRRFVPVPHPAEEHSGVS